MLFIPPPSLNKPINYVCFIDDIPIIITENTKVSYPEPCSVKIITGNNRLPL